MHAGLGTCTRLLWACYWRGACIAAGVAAGITAGIAAGGGLLSQPAMSSRGLIATMPERRVRMASI
jgi:hypothetical protein